MRGPRRSPCPGCGRCAQSHRSPPGSRWAPAIMATIEHHPEDDGGEVRVRPAAQVEVRRQRRRPLRQVDEQDAAPGPCRSTSPVPPSTMAANNWIDNVRGNSPVFTTPVESAKERAAQPGAPRARWRRPPPSCAHVDAGQRRCDLVVADGPEGPPVTAPQQVGQEDGARSARPGSGSRPATPPDPATRVRSARSPSTPGRRRTWPAICPRSRAAANAKSSVMPARYGPLRRVAGRPIATPAAAATAAAATNSRTKLVPVCVMNRPSV